MKWPHENFFFLSLLVILENLRPNLKNQWQGGLVARPRMYVKDHRLTVVCPNCPRYQHQRKSTCLFIFSFLTNSLLQPCTSHKLVHLVLWHQERWFHGGWWWSWRSRWRGPGRRPGPGCQAWAWVLGRSIWPGCMGPSCSHHCTVTGYRDEERMAVVKKEQLSKETKHGMKDKDIAMGTVF